MMRARVLRSAAGALVGESPRMQIAKNILVFKERRGLGEVTIR